MPTTNWTRVIIALAALVSASIVLATGGRVDLNLARAVVTASTVVVLFLLAFDRWLWRWPGIRRLARRPVLHGTWKTELKTSYATRKDEVIEAYLVIRQTYSKICVDMLFDRSRSTSMSGDLVRENGRCVLYYVFRSDKQTLERDENPPARGAAQLTVAAKPSVHLAGDYWMEHGTHGHVATIGRSPLTYDTYSAAQRGGYRQGG
jgi:hypothetical protein